MEVLSNSHSSFEKDKTLKTLRREISQKKDAQSNWVGEMEQIIKKKIQHQNEIL